MKVICGQAPVIPWWRLQSMSDADIAQHNRKYLMKVEMKPDYKRIVEYVETAPQPIKDVWNAAIEAVLKIWDDIGPNETDVEIGERFRSLKK